MTAEFIKYELSISLLIAIAALGIERVCALYRWPRRFLWASAIIASLVLPLSMALTTKPDKAADNTESISPTWSPISDPSVPTAALSLNERARLNVPVMTVRASDSSKQYSAHLPISLDEYLKLAWLALSVACLSYYGFVWLRLRQRVARSPSQDIDGIQVRITDGLGPAAFGVVRPEILMPRWILEVPPRIRSLALEHERQHIAARDPTLLFGAVIAFVLMPWNLVLRWMLRRLRFCLEADCDARVLRNTADARTYAEALLAICQHHTPTPPRSLVLTTSVSWLERRVRIMVAGTSQLSRVLAASGSVWALALLATAILLHAPGLAAPGELRKLPPDDTKPGTEAVRGIARTRFPELFGPSFKGVAQLIMVLNRDGTVVRARERIYTPDKLPRILSVRIAEDSDLELDPSDILYGDVVDIRPPSRERTERALGYIDYEVLKWPHDPMRAESRVKSAVVAYFPELRTTPAPPASICVHHVAVLMNDDGSVQQAHKVDMACHRNDHEIVISLSADEENRLDDFGIPESELGRSGLLSFEVSKQPVQVRYTWPRHADDPPDVVELSKGQVNAAMWQQHKPREDTLDDAGIIARFFPDIAAHGNADLIRTIGGHRYRIEPWILFGRDGQIWGTGRSLAWVNSDTTYRGAPLQEEIEARYPGTRVGEELTPTLLVHGVPIHGVWISADSPVQKISDVAPGSRKDLLLYSEFLQEMQAANPTPRVPQPHAVPFANAMNFGSPAGIGIAQLFIERTGQSTIPVTTRLIATEAGPDAVDLQVQTRIDVTTALSQPPSQAWERAATIRVRYGSSGTVDLFFTGTDPPSKLQLVLRPQLLRDRPDEP